jgi:hypothetical protein
MTTPERGNDVGARKGLAMGCVEPVVTLSTSSRVPPCISWLNYGGHCTSKQENVELLRQLRAA